MSASELNSYDPSHLDKIIREIVSTSAGSYFMTDMSMHEVEIRDDFVYGEVMSAILIHSTEFVSLLKIHYSYSDINNFLEKSGISSSEKPASVDDIEDSMNEFANLAGGRVVENMGLRGVRCSLSIPVTSPGYDEILSSDIILAHEFRDYFTLKDENRSLTITTSNKIKDPNILTNFKQEIETVRVESAFF